MRASQYLHREMPHWESHAMRRAAMLTEARLRADLSTAQVAMLVHMDNDEIRSIERGRRFACEAVIWEYLYADLLDPEEAASIVFHLPYPSHMS